MTLLNNNKQEKSIHIIACGVFRPLLEELHLAERFPGLHVTYLPSNLHLNPAELKNQLLRDIMDSQKKNELIICLYGECFQDIDDICKKHGVIKIEGHHCYDMFLGREKFREIMDENARTYFLEKELILNFQEYCVKPLELYDRDMKELFFKNYERLVYVRQPSDPDLIANVNIIADFLGLSVSVFDADYSAFEQALLDLIGYGHK